MNLDDYRQQAETFLSQLDREYYQHFSGQQDEFRVAQIYERFSDLFSSGAIEQLRELAADSTADEERRLRSLLQFSVDGHIGQATKTEEQELAAKEASLELDLDGEKVPFRQSALILANESDPTRRAQIEAARLELTENELNPLYEHALERAHQLAKELGWADYRSMYQDLRGIDFGALERETRAFSEATEPLYKEIVGPELERQLGYGFEHLQRADLAYFMRAAWTDEYFPAERLVPSFRETLSGLGIDLASQDNVILDLEDRPNKTARAFCAPVQVPSEIYLVVPRVGGRDDYFALFHEGGHSEHYAHVSSELPFEYRYLGDNSVTEAFAYLFHHLIEDPNWLSTYLGIEGASELAGYARASKIIYLRRYAAKLRYELELHRQDAQLGQMRDRYSRLLGDAIHVEWPGATYLSDVDGGYYASSYLRAWALEANLRQILKERFGDHWFSQQHAGDFLKKIWGYGQRLNADELLEEISGRRLDFSIMTPT